MPLRSSRPRPASSVRRRRRRAQAGRALALLGAAMQIVGVFLPWDASGRPALELGLLSLGERTDLPTVGLTLVALAAVAALPALVTDHPLPRVVSAAGTAGLALTWLLVGPVDAIPSGVAIVLAATAAHLAAAAASRRRGGTVTAAASGRHDDGEAAPHGSELLDHTADVAFTAWGPTRAACFAQAAHALVTSFAEIDAVGISRQHDLTLEPASDEDLLVDLLSEVIYLQDAHGELAVGGTLRDRQDGGLEGHLTVVPQEEARQAGAVPKAITYHGLDVTRGSDGAWRCHVTIDV